MSWATCHTGGCENAGIPIDVGQLSWTDEVIGETFTSSVCCGPCGQPITDISETPPPQPKEGNPA